MTKPARALALIACLLPLAAPLRAAEPVRVLLWKLRSMGVDSEIAERIESLLGKEIARLPGFQRVELGSGAADCDGGAACLLELGRGADAKLVVSGVLGRLGDTFSLDAKVIDAADGRELRRIAQTWGGGDETLIDVMRQVACRLLSPKDYLGRLQLDINQPDVKVYIDGDYAGRSPLDALPLRPGRHALKLIREGYADVERFVDIAFDRSLAVRIELQSTDVHEVIESVKDPEWLVVGLDLGLVTNFDSLLAPRLRLDAGWMLPFWGRRLCVGLSTGLHGARMSSTAHGIEPADLDVDGELLAWTTQLGVTLRLLPDHPFSPYLGFDGGLSLVWQRLTPQGFSTQGFRSTAGVFRAAGGLEYRLGPGVVFLQASYQHLRLDGSRGGFQGLLGGLDAGCGYRLMI
ncbi:MAG: PEGA domain-containing protein [Deltaproteobacteria bacterium]|nr:PEGA domain-containing protein [Deltaproteobacteria bacterium]